MQDNVIKHPDDIQAEKKTLKGILEDHYTLDYYQREYNWEKEQIDQLIEDLDSAFREYYEEDHHSREVESYGTYYMGPVVFSKNEQNQEAIVDGQQRLTSLTLLLLYLNHQQKRLLPDKKPVGIESLIYADRYGVPAFKIQDEGRNECMRGLLNKEEYQINEKEDSASVKNIVERYNDIASRLEDNFWGEKAHALRPFLYWLVNKVILVRITADTPDKAYLIFETMNDRGLRLRYSDMLKAYLLSKVKDTEEQQRLNSQWRNRMKNVNDLARKDADAAFFQAWLRGHYAESIRDTKKDAKNKDFEDIGTRFHIWVRDNIKLTEADKWYQFINKEINFYIQNFLNYHDARANRQAGLEHVYRVKFLGFADSLLDPLILAPIKQTDDEQTIGEKMNVVARYVETFCVRRKVNFESYGHSRMRYATYNLVKQIRRKNIPDLKRILEKDLSESSYDLNGIIKNKEGEAFTLKWNQNKRFIKFFLACLTVYVERQSGRDDSILGQYMMPGPKKKTFDIEHIVGRNYNDNIEEYKSVGYESEEDFNRTRDQLGALVLLRSQSNQAFSNQVFGDKGTYYGRENLLALSLCASCYRKNSPFIQFIKEENLPFKWYINDEKHALTDKQRSFMSDEAKTQQKLFSKKSIDERQHLYKAIAERVWRLEFFND